jgi:tetratricopeptide (TPR) repeat protein
MRELGSIIQEGLNFYHTGQLDKAEFIFDQLLAKYPGNSDVMGLLGSLYSKLGKNGAAIAMLSASVESAEVKNPGFWSNLAACLKRENHMQEAEIAFVEALETDPDNVNTLANFSGLYINAGCPEKAEEIARKAISLHESAFTSFINIDGQPQEDEVAYNLAKHHLSLALLEQDKWEEAWTLYDNRKTTEGWQRPVYDPPLWKGEQTGTLVIHGEQGIGDEIMYLSLVEQIKDRAREIVVETTPRLVPLMRRSLGVDVYPNMESIIQAGIKPDHVIAMGSLPGIVNLKRKDAKSLGYLIPDQARKAYWRKKLVEMSHGRPIIGIAWQGGVQQTHKALRNPPKDLWKTLDPDKYFLVSVQYTPNAAQFAQELGSYHPQLAIDDLDEQCALIASLDCLVTVAQTSMHFAGGTNTPCIGLISSKPRWDCIGETEDEMPWWKSLKLIRQKADWAEVFVRLNQELEARYAASTDIAAE